MSPLRETTIAIAIVGIVINIKRAKVKRSHESKPDTKNEAKRLKATTSKVKRAITLGAPIIFSPSVFI